MQPTSLFLLPLLSFLLLFHDTAHAECEPRTCGDLTVKYPFWLGGVNESSSPCGHPAFQVRCSNDGGAASLMGSAINVLRVDYDNNSFVASHSRIAGGNDGVCRTDFNISVSIALSPFKFSSRNRALCFLYNCSGGTEPRGPEFVNATSVCNSPIYAYLGGNYYWDSPPAIATGRCKYTFFPVLESEEAATMTAANYPRLLKDGFILEWQTVSVGDCPACVASGGQCRYNNATAAFACLCPDGKLRRTSSCVGESIPVPSHLLHLH
ncbi:hypothetical protein PR202_gb26525 [Eleusine coracana subsp. coracana]|uniref:Uncharacterized protein n=1 Tax=Eleusine coracana subsp. coracana TaxID=191504 RepID=A0AAV5FPE8_ELECO|nr:hypothetical protein QOZ80_1BG0057500 [Eleusine coracana subsp. coracana]GJN37554.1 hypothetical protein PR202_gb26525 [Eleusine coracana subsp. coracana]